MALFRRRKPAVPAAEREAREYDEMEAAAMYRELEALEAGDYEEAAYCDVDAHVYRTQAARLRGQS